MATYSELSPLELDEATDENAWELIDFLNEDGEIMSFDCDVNSHRQPGAGLAGETIVIIDVIIPLAAIDYACDPEEDINNHFEGLAYEELNTEHEKIIPKAEFMELTNPQMEQKATIEQYNRFNKFY
jgi:hypothetical protein